MSDALNKEILMRLGVDKLHAISHKGARLKGGVIENIGSSDGHELTTKRCALFTAPELPITILQNETGVFTKAKELGINMLNVSMEDVSMEGFNEYVAWGGVVFVAVGNGTPSELNRETRFISVGMITLNGMVPAWSAKTEAIDLVSYVPYLPNSEGSYIQPNGTSFASPTAMGAMACVLDYWISIGYKYNQADVEQYMRKHAIDTQAIGFDQASGYGIVKVDTMNTVKATIGQNILVVNGIVKPIPQGSVLVNGNTMVPFRAIGDAIHSVTVGKEVVSIKTDWDATTKTAMYFIDTK